MKHKIFLFIFIFILLNSTSLFAARNQYYYGWHSQLECKITPDFPEISTGEIATFTITLRNKTDKTIDLQYKTGQEWDMVVMLGNQQVFRWSSPYIWSERPFSQPLKPGATKSTKLSWKAVSTVNQPLTQNTYTVRGIAMLSPKHLISEDCHIRLIPRNTIKKEIIKAKLNRIFTIELPSKSDDGELIWYIKYKYNDNRISLQKYTRDLKTIKFFMKPKRYGHVEFDIYGYPAKFKSNQSIERRSYRVEVTNLDD